MAYMVYQRYTTAVKRAYRERPEVPEMHAHAVEFRAWLESLDIDATIRAELVEQARSVEHGFEALLRSLPPTVGAVTTPEDRASCRQPTST